MSPKDIFMLRKGWLTLKAIERKEKWGLVMEANNLLQYSRLLMVVG